MAVPKETIWQIEPHTSAKHQILRKYLDAWLPILGTYNLRVVYVDGFAGPGKYTGGEPGSPIVALQAALTHEAKLPGELVFLLRGTGRRSILPLDDIRDHLIDPPA
ncbi:MAG: three-Cys-motif partner protein TcmP [Bryobacteraceae bacterium]